MDVEWCKDDSCFIVSSCGLTAEDNKLMIWDSDTLELKGEILSDIQLDEDGEVDFKCFLDIEVIPNTNIVVIGSTTNADQRLIDIDQRESVSLFPTPVSGTATIEPSHSGDYLAVEYDGYVAIVSMNNGEEVARIPTEMNVDVIEWNASDELLFVASSDTSEFVVWQIDSGEIILTNTIENARFRMADWHPDKNFIAVSTDRYVWLWNVEAKDKWLIHNGYGSRIQWSPDGKKLAVTSREGLYVYSGFDQIAEIEF